jgi:molybdopterin molybdotransferase
VSLGPLEASARILEGVRALEAVEVPLADAAGRALASAVHARVTLPPWDNAGMDGYAVHADDVRGARHDAPRRLRLVATVAAGDAPPGRLGRGEAMRIMTGAPLPQGADSVVRVEDSDAAAEGEVLLFHDRDAGRNVRPRGEDVAEGAVALDAGAVLGPAQLAFLASVGAARVPVHRVPRVAVLSTGSELVSLTEFDRVGTGGHIVDSNNWSLGGAARGCGAEVIAMGVGADDAAAIAARLREAAAHADLVVTSGGVSMGAFDHLRGALVEAGGSLDFFRASIRPGGPLSYGHIGASRWLGLPGNPVSALVTFELFARPLILRLAGHRRLFRRPVPVIAGEAIAIGAPLTHFLRARLTVGSPGMLHATLTGPQGSGLLHSMAQADALLVVPPERPRIAAGEQLHALVLADAPMLAEMAL